MKVRLLDWERCVFRWMCWGLNVDRKNKKDTGATATGLSPRNWCGKSQYSLVYYGQQYSIAWRKTWIVSHITWLSRMNSWMLTWIDTVRFVVHCLTIFWILQPTWILSFPMSYYHWKECGVFWVKESQHFAVLLEHKPPHVIWAIMAAAHYWPPLWSVLQLETREHMKDVWY